MNSDYQGIAALHVSRAESYANPSSLRWSFSGCHTGVRGYASIYIYYVGSFFHSDITRSFLEITISCTVQYGTCSRFRTPILCVLLVLWGNVLQIVLDENPVLDELSVEYVPQIGFLTTLNAKFCDLAPPDFTFAFSQVNNLF